MFSVNSLERVEVKGRGFIFIIESPVRVARNHEAMIKALGGKIKIDGTEYKPTGFEWHVPSTPVYIGEKIGVSVKV